ncbi:IS701 family transposase [Deinococcus sp. VB142]|uniref:IS701 family transposase n=1 Tax=Deinococcus sp. VB142 TaxID=3112952 RepID=A0AAU6Q7A6_9DEIO
MPRSLPPWTRHFPTWFAPFLTHFRHRAQRTWAPLYVRGLCSAAHRKSMQPLAAAVVAPGKEDHIQQFITDSPWSTGPLETLLAQRAEEMLGGKDAVLIIDDTCLTKFGTKSVGVARQYSGQVGKITTCQCLVSLTLAQHELPVPVALRLFLPQEWTHDPARLGAAGVPLEHQLPQTKWELALKELDRVSEHVTFGMVLDAGYGVNAQFRHALTERGLLWSVGITRTQTVYPKDVRLIPIPKHFRGRRPKYPTTSHDRQTVEEVLNGAAWQHLVWRHGTKGPLSGRFAAVYVRLADGDENAQGQHLPGQGAWVIGEQRRGEERKYYTCNLPPETPFPRLIEATKRRWACELTHRELKEEVGLDHFEGRSWQGLHHHAVLCMVALNFLQWLRLTQPDDLHGDTVPAIRAEVAGDLPLPPQCRQCRACTALFSGP